MKNPLFIEHHYIAALLAYNGAEMVKHGLWVFSSSAAFIKKAFLGDIAK
ncbi:MAG: hypothetical protein Q7U68_01410 [Candidatus Roizmanbacteria bacterium]|nr:hypothetical protein [Candidatus Roizmanbacteria bacterium]